VKRGRKMTRADLGLLPEGEWWILIDPRKNIWAQTTEAIARNHPVAQYRTRHAFTYRQMEQLYDQ
jgi:hypothetical protein